MSNLSKCSLIVMNLYCINLAKLEQLCPESPFLDGSMLKLSKQQRYTRHKGRNETAVLSESCGRMQ